MSAAAGAFDFRARLVAVALGQTAVKLAPTLGAVVLVRLLSPADWASLALLLSIYLAAQEIGSLFLPQSVPFFLGHIDLQARPKFLRQTSLLLGLSALLTAAIVYAITSQLSPRAYAGAAQAALPLALALAFEIPALAFPQVLIALERVRAGALWNGGFALVQIVALLLPIVRAQGIVLAIWGLALSAALRFLAFVALAFPFLRNAPVEAKAGWRFDSRMLREQIAYALPLGLSMATFSLNRQVDKWMVAWLEPDKLGTYALAAVEFPFIALLPLAAGSVLATRMVWAFRQGREGQAYAYWIASTARMSVLVPPLVAALLSVAGDLVVLLFGSTYTAASLPFQLYTLISLHRIAEYGALLRAAGDTRFLWFVSIGLLALNSLLTLPLLMLFGMAGAALAALLANLGIWMVVLRRIAFLLDCSFRSVLPWRTYGLGVLGAFLCAAVAYVLVEFLLPLPSPGLRAAFKVAVVLVAYALFAKLLRLPSRLPRLPSDEPELLEHFSRRPPQPQVSAPLPLEPRRGA